MKRNTTRQEPMTRRARKATDALEMLKTDHRTVEKMFKEFERLHKADSQDGAKREVVDRACAALTVHTQVEEEIFYPAVRALLQQQVLGDEALIEHAIAKELIAKLEGLEPRDSAYDATFTVLSEYVKHHVQDEEKEMFPEISKAKIDLQALGTEIRRRKEELEDQDGPREADADDVRTRA